MKYELVRTGRFQRDCKKYGYILSDGTYKDPLKSALNTLASGNMLDSTYEDHKLSGKWKGYREFHVEFDLVCVYKIQEKQLILEAVRLGTHHDVFGDSELITI